MRPLGKCPFSMSNGQQESWHRERVWVRYQKKDLPSASSSLNSIRLSVLQTADFSLPPHLKNMFYVVFNRGLISYWSQPCSMQTQMTERKKINLDPTVHCCFPSLLDYLFLSLCLFNGERTALCSNFEQQPCGHSSPSYSRELCYSTKKSGETPLLDQMA